MVFEFARARHLAYVQLSLLCACNVHVQADAQVCEVVSALQVLINGGELFKIYLFNTAVVHVHAHMDARMLVCSVLVMRAHKLTLL
jgi:hypothetical protein